MFQKIDLEDIVYHPTFICNLSCRGCVNYSNHLETRNIPAETNWDRDLKILFERFNVKHIEVAGGETLMFQTLKDLIACLAPAEKYTVTTNGLLLYKNKWLKELLDTDPKLNIAISIHYDPKIETTYTKNLFNSIAEFLDITPAKVKSVLSRHSISTRKPGFFFFIQERVFLRYAYNSPNNKSWLYPVLDSNELPTLFNNNKEEAYNQCMCPSPHLKDGKIYKCPMTAMLLKVVESKNLYNSNWQFLKDYEPYNLLSDHNLGDWNRLRTPEDVCSRCPVGESQWDRKKTDLHSKII